MIESQVDGETIELRLILLRPRRSADRPAAELLKVQKPARAAIEFTSLKSLTE